MTSPSNSPISRHIRVGKSDNKEDDDDDVYVHKHILFIKYCLTNSSLPYSTDTYCHAFVFVFVSLFVVFHDKYQKLQMKDIAAIYQTLPMGSFFDEKVPFDLILI